MQKNSRSRDPLAKLLVETQEMVGKLVRENRALKLRNRQLTQDLDRSLAGWDDLKRLARLAPRRRRARG